MENRILVRDLLRVVGFDVRTASNGQEAVDVNQEWSPHLVWMDIRMPGMDGYEATKLIKGEGGRDVVVIALTASVFEEERTKVLEAGFDGFVRKPFTEDDIFAEMAEHLGVRYIYEEVETDKPDGESFELDSADLADLPIEWKTEMSAAATRGRTQELLDMIAQIEEAYPQQARGLRRMVAEFQFQEIVALMG